MNGEIPPGHFEQGESSLPPFLSGSSDATGSQTTSTAQALADKENADAFAKTQADKATADAAAAQAKVLADAAAAEQAEKDRQAAPAVINHLGTDQQPGWCE